MLCNVREIQTVLSYIKGVNDTEGTYMGVEICNI